VAFWQAVWVLVIEPFAQALFRGYLTTAVDGAEHLPRGPMLICSNHTSHLDSAALMLASGRGFDEFRLLAAADYFTTSSLVGRVTRRLFHLITVDRTGGHAARLRQTVAACRRQGRVSFIAFPEGTRSPTGRLLPFKRGAAFLAVELGLPVVPAFVAGTATALPKGRWIPRRSRVDVAFGPPILPDDWATLPGPGGATAFVAAELERRVHALAGNDEVGAKAAPSARPRARCRSDRHHGQTAQTG